MTTLRRIALVLLLILSLTFTSCKTNTAEYEQKFEMHQSETPVVVVLDGLMFYFAGQTLDLRDLLDDEELNGGYQFIDQKLYFSTSKENGLFDFSLSVYRCDMDGSNKVLIFEKDGYKTHPKAIGSKGMLYIEHYEGTAFDSSSKRIDLYNIFSDTYENVSLGDVASLSSYKNNKIDLYSFNFANDVLNIVNIQNSKNYKIDYEFLQKSEFGEALTDLDCSYESYHVTEGGQIYLLYRIQTSTPLYPFFLCEFIPQENKVDFCFLFFAYDVVGFDIESIT